MKFATAYNAKKLRAGEVFGTHNDQESLTNQADAKDADINVIMKRYAQTGQLPAVTTNALEGGDYTAVGDFRDCLDRVTQAQEKFKALPAPIRKRFGNDPAQFLEFVGNEGNRAEAEKMGLTMPKKDEYSKDARGIIDAVAKLGEKDEDQHADREIDGKAGRARQKARPTQGK